MHQFDSPPAMVLDIGCGTGMWILEAAKRWPVCAILLNLLHAMLM